MHGDRRVGLAVLDLAGTTLAITDAVPAALESAFADADIAVPPAVVAALRGRSKREAIRALVAELAPDRERPDDLAGEVFAAFRRKLLGRYAAGVEPIAGAADTLRFLRTEGIRVVLTTGFDRPLAEHLLREVGWGANLMDGLVTADDVTHGRPHPATIHRAMEMAAVTSAGFVVAVGDTRADLQAARNAGVVCAIGVLTGAHTREQLAAEPNAAILDSVADLPAWLRANEISGP